MWLIVLTGFLAPLGVLISWNTISERKKLFYVLFLLQQVAMFGVFVSLDLFLYYAFWELTLVPMTILIAIFGRTDKRRRAAIKFFLYAFIPSAILLVAMLWLYAKTGTFDIPALAQLAATHSISPDSAALWLASLAFLAAFAVKVPIFPLHGWLSDAVSEAPPPWSWSSPASSASTPSCASPSASSPMSPATSPRSSLPSEPSASYTAHYWR